MGDSWIMRRRDFIAVSLMASLWQTIPGNSEEVGIPLHVMKDPNCGCCNKWAEILSQNGFEVTTEDLIGSDLIKYKIESGISIKMASCHTARVFDYVIEGHVPPKDIKRLIREKPIAIGLAVPKMPYGSPGMGPEAKREAYDVFLLKEDGTTSLFSRYNAAT